MKLSQRVTSLLFTLAPLAGLCPGIAYAALAASRDRGGNVKVVGRGD